jgi:hypothetical protein
LPLVVNVQGEGTGCYVGVNGAKVTSERLVQIARAERNRRAIVVFAKDAPYKCVGSAVVVLQQGGIAKIDVAPWFGR